MKKLKVLAVLLMIINIFTCFIPAYFYEEIWEYKRYGSYSATQTAKFGATMFDINTGAIAHSGIGYALACVTVVCWILYICVLLYSIIRNKNSKTLLAASGICFIPFFALIGFMKNAEYYWHSGGGYTAYSVNWLFYISLALQISAAVLVLIAITSKEEKLKFAIRTREASEIDELKEYKDLLDSGVISQEEFDAKKKQLLGL